MKLTYLIANNFEKSTIFLVGVVMKKYGCKCCSAKWILCKVKYFRRLTIKFQIHFLWISKSKLTKHY